MCDKKGNVSFSIVNEPLRGFSLFCQENWSISMDCSGNELRLDIEECCFCLVLAFYNNLPAKNLR